MEELKEPDLRAVHLKNCYDSDNDDVLNNFYIPVLNNSITYLRISGFFSSSALAVAAKGIQGLLNNSGEMKLIAGVVLSKEDLIAIERGIKSPDEVISNTAINDLENIENDFIKDHVSALSWLVAKNKLKIKLAVLVSHLDLDYTRNYGIFHQKFGIFQDGIGNKICFSGSINETQTAWKYNIEDFNVFRSWVPDEQKYLGSIFERFEKYWLGDTNRAKVIDVPTAIKDKLVRIAPKTIEELHLERWTKETILKNKLKENENQNYNSNISLREYQEKAISNWVKNEYNGIFEMATGTGKTFTALGCVQKFLSTHKKNVVIISVPYQHLAKQWDGEIDSFGLNIERIIADSSNRTWKNDVSNKLIDIYLGYKENFCILTTHATLCSNDFISIINKNKNLNYLLIGDEVHGLGSTERKNGLLDLYKFRLGLSATPKRWFDELGTEDLFNFFGDVVFDFDLWRAINTINPATGQTFLVPYRYEAEYISLSNEEMEEYVEKCMAIVRLYGKAKDDLEAKEIYERLLFKRADIIKNAEKKYLVFEKLIDELRDDIAHTIIYCSPQQMNRIKLILKHKRVISHSFTMNEKTKPEYKFGGISEREFILKKFADGEYQALVAMKCLDEGVNVPPAKRAILMASSGNPKEYIQRIGRILRRYPGKKLATIHDIVVVPSKSKIPSELKELELKIFNNEIKRYEEIAKNAINNSEALDKIYKYKT